MSDITKLATVPQIEKLHGSSNYHTWKSLAMPFLHIMGVADIVIDDVLHLELKASSSMSAGDGTIVNDTTT